jgi:hypothetical protein
MRVGREPGAEARARLASRKGVCTSYSNNLLMNADAATNSFEISI